MVVKHGCLGECFFTETKHNLIGIRYGDGLHGRTSGRLCGDTGCPMKSHCISLAVKADGAACVCVWQCTAMGAGLFFCGKLKSGGRDQLAERTREGLRGGRKAD